MSYFIRLIVSVVIVLLSITPSLYAAPKGAPKVIVSTTSVTMGETIKVDVISDRILKKKSIGFTNKPFKLIRIRSKKSKYHYRAYVAASRKLKTNTYPLKVYYEYKNHQKGVKKFSITVKHPQKKKGKVTLTKKKNALSRNQKQLSKESRIISKGFKKLSPKAYFKNPFIYPSKGKLTSGFGVQRYYNGSYSRSHAGVDIANKINTPVNAPNHGIVILSKKLKVHGHTIMIDHGMGIVTIYNHLNKRLVRKNKRVRTDDRIGTIGKTGVATGPHLHWGMSVQNVRVDPLFWVKKNK
jgi:murein DD-endopeptidase MepM/ murein hydrolase activator NlpD